MKVYVAGIEKRKGASSVIGIYKSVDKARAAVKKYVEAKYTKEAIKFCQDQFGGNLNKGQFYSEEEAVEVTDHDTEEGE